MSSSVGRLRRAVFGWLANGRAKFDALSRVDQLRLIGALLPLWIVILFLAVALDIHGSVFALVVLALVLVGWFGPFVVYWQLSKAAGPLLGQTWLLWAAAAFALPPVGWLIMYFWKEDREETRVYVYHPGECVACSGDLGSDYTTRTYYTAVHTSTQSLGSSYEWSSGSTYQHYRLTYIYPQQHDLKVCPACIEKEKRRVRWIAILGIGAIACLFLGIPVGAGIGNVLGMSGGMFGPDGDALTFLMMLGPVGAFVMGIAAAILHKMPLDGKLRRRAEVIRGGSSISVFSPEEYQRLKPG